MSDEIYTLAEAERKLAWRECMLHGHDFAEVLLLGSGDPTLLVCTRCGRQWPIGNGEGGQA